MTKRKPRRTSRPISKRPVRTSEIAQTKSEPVDLVKEYHYVVSDLGQIAIIAAVLIAGLVGLSFFLK